MQYLSDGADDARAHYWFKEFRRVKRPRMHEPFLGAKHSLTQFITKMCHLNPFRHLDIRGHAQ